MKILKLVQKVLLSAICLLLLFMILTPVKVYTKLEPFLESQRKNYGFPSLSAALVTLDEPTVFFTLGCTSQGISPQPKTPYFIASLSKSFTALAVNKLSRDYGFSLDTPISELISEYKSVFNYGDKITVRHLLSHASGLSDITFQENLPWDASIYEGAMSLAKAKPLTSIETKFNYFNMGYTVLGYLIEKVTETSFSDYLKTEILEPLNLNNTFVSTKEAPITVNGHISLFGFLKQLDNYQKLYALPSGFILSSTYDLSILARYYLDPTTLPNNSGLLPIDLLLLQTPAFKNWPYGFGWFISQERGYHIVQHSGSLEGYLSHFLFWPEKKTAFIILTNSNSTFQSLFAVNSIIKGTEAILFDGQTVIKPVCHYINFIFWLLTLFLQVSVLKQFFSLGKYRFNNNLKNTVFLRTFYLSTFIFWLMLFIFFPFLAGQLINRGLNWSFALSIEPCIFGLLGFLFLTQALIGFIRFFLLFDTSKKYNR